MFDDVADLEGLSEVGHRRRGRGGKERRLAGKWVLDASEHDAAAGAGVAEAPRRAPAVVRRVDASRRSRRCERHARDRAAPRADPRRARHAARLRDVRRVHARRPDGEDARGGDQAADRHRARRPWRRRASEAATMQTLIDAQTRRLQARAVGLAVLLGAGAQGQVRPRRVADQTVLRARSRAARRRVLRRDQLYGLTFKERRDLPVYQPDVRVFEVFDADGSSLGALLHRLLQARQQERRRVDGQLRRPVAPARHESRWSSTSRTSRSRRRVSRRCSASTTSSTHVPRVRPRAARAASRRRRIRSISGHERAARLRRVPVAVQRTLGARSDVLAHYARHYKTGAADAGRRSCDQDQAVGKFNQGFMTSPSTIAAARTRPAWHTLSPAATPADVDAFENAALAKYRDRRSRCTAPLSHQLLRAHLGRRLRGGLLRVPVGTGAGR